MDMISSWSTFDSSLYSVFSLSGDLVCDKPLQESIMSTFKEDQLY